MITISIVSSHSLLGQLLEGINQTVSNESKTLFISIADEINVSEKSLLEIEKSRNADNYLYGQFTEFYNNQTNEWESHLRKYYRYSFDGHLIQKTTRIWKEEWVNELLSEYTPDEQGFSSYTTDSRWDQYLSKWIVTSSFERERDNEGRLIKLIRYHAYEGELIPSVRLLREYDEYHNQTLNEQDIWNKSLNIWIGETKWTKKFKDQKKAINSEFYVWHDETLQWIYKNGSEWEYESTFDKVSGRKDLVWENSTQSWIIEKDHQYIYNSIGEITMDTSYNVSYQNKERTPYLFGISDFNSAGNPVKGVRHVINSFGEWAPYYQRDHTYDAGGNEIKFSVSNFDVDTNEITNQSRTEYGYDELGRKVMESRYNWYQPTDRWWGTAREETAYDEYGNRYLHNYFTWDDESNSWIKARKEECHFNESGQATSYSEYYWNRELSEWYGKSKRDISYDENGNTESTTSYRWNDSISGWTFSTRNTYEYLPLKKYQAIEFTPPSITYGDTLELNGKSDSELALTYYSMDTTKAVIIEDRMIATGVGDMKILISQEGNHEYEKNELLVSILIDKANLNAQVNDITIQQNLEIPNFTISYSGFLFNDDESVIEAPIASTEAINTEQSGNFEIYLNGGYAETYELNLKNGTLTIEKALSTPIRGFKIYPNPVDDWLSVHTPNLKKIRIFDMSGQQVIELAKNSTGIYDVSNLSPSTYSLIVETATGLSVGKLIKQ